MMTIQDILKEKIPNYESKSLPEIVEEGRKIIFNFNYPTLNEEEKTLIETTFIIKFFTRYINRDTFEYWQLKLYGVLNMIMPYYNNRISSEDWFKELENPLFNYNITETLVASSNSDSTSKSNSNSSDSMRSNANSSSTSTSTDDTFSQNSSKSTTGNKNDSTTTSNSNSVSESKVLNSEMPQSQYDEMTDYLTNSGINHSESNSNSNSTTKGTSSTDSKANSNSSNTTNSNSNNESMSDSTSKSSSKSNTESSSNGNSNSESTMKRVGFNYGQAIGEIVERNRKAFINVIEEILRDEEVLNLFVQLDFQDEPRLTREYFPWGWLVWY